MPSQLLPFLLAALLIELTPGPNMTYLALVSASKGRTAGFATVAGVGVGLAIIGIIAAFGLAEVIQASPLLYNGLRWSGVAFLLYLAWEGWTAGTDLVKNAADGSGRYFSRGLITNLLNPKAAIFYVSVLPSFIDTTAALATQAVLLTAAYVAVATLIHSCIVLLAGYLEPLLNDPKREKFARRLLSALLGLVAVWFAWSTHL